MKNAVIVMEQLARNLINMLVLRETSGGGQAAAALAGLSSTRPRDQNNRVFTSRAGFQVDMMINCLRDSNRAPHAAVRIMNGVVA